MLAAIKLLAAVNVNVCIVSYEKFYLDHSLLECSFPRWSNLTSRRNELVVLVMVITCSSPLNDLLCFKFTVQRSC